MCAMGIGTGTRESGGGRKVREGSHMKSESRTFQRIPQTDTDRAKGWREGYKKLTPAREN